MSYFALPVCYTVCHSPQFLASIKAKCIMSDGFNVSSLDFENRKSWFGGQMTALMWNLIYERLVEKENSFKASETLSGEGREPGTLINS